MRGKFATRYLAFAAIAATSFATSASTNAFAHPVVFDAPKTALSDPIDPSRDITAESNLYCLALAVYFEGGSTEESEEGQRHIAHVVVSRARANRKIWGGSNICDVVFHKVGKVCQFSFACLATGQRTARGGAAWAYSKQIARDELEGRSGLDDRSLRYYMNSGLSAPKNACRFRKEFVPVIQAGRHEFFREATRAERRELEKGEYTECKKYEASLKKKKQAGKKDKKPKGDNIAKNDIQKNDAKKNDVANKDVTNKDVTKKDVAKKDVSKKDVVKKDKGKDVAKVAKKQPSKKVTIAKR